MTAEKRLILDWTKAHDVSPLEKNLTQELPALVAAKKEIVNDGTHDFTGWVHYVKEEAPRAIAALDKVVSTISSHSDAVVVVGIGGSLLGAKAVYESLTHSFALAQHFRHPARRPSLFWAGHHVALDELVELMDTLDSFSPSLVVISKSGGTTEPAMAFRILKSYLEDRFGAAEARHRIFAITDPQEGTLLKIAKEEGYPHFPIPRDVGGRYSVFTPVGLLPLALAGIDTAEFVKGGVCAFQDCALENNHSLETNPALCYAGVRNILYKNGFKIESLCTWSPKTRSLSEWWKQLFGESDGKEHTGIFPASVQFTTDLHSMGQYFQEGERHLFATHVRFQEEYSLSRASIKRKIKIPATDMEDGFGFLAGEDLFRVQTEAQQGTFLAHSDGQVPTLVWEIPELNAFWLGYWMYVNMLACAVGGVARGVNPFNQPGVENYKVNMFALLNKPGYQEKSAQIRGRLQTNHRLRSLGFTSR